MCEIFAYICLVFVLKIAPMSFHITSYNLGSVTKGSFSFTTLMCDLLETESEVAVPTSGYLELLPDVPVSTIHSSKYLPALRHWNHVTFIGNVHAIYANATMLIIQQQLTLGRI